MAFAEYKPFTRTERINRWLKSKVRSSDLSGDGDMSDCAYYRGMGTCSYGCREEPACMTDMPIHGWPLDRPWFFRVQHWVRIKIKRLRCSHTIGADHKPAFQPVFTAKPTTAPGRLVSIEAGYSVCVMCGKARKDS